MRLQARVGVATLIGAAALFSWSATTASAAAPHTVAAGETLWSIAAANNLTTATVAAFNGVSEDYQVTLGETIQVPTVDEGAAALTAAGTSTSTASTSTTAAAGSHAVVAGETLSGIAAANGVSVEALASANGRSADSLVYEGESLAIPAATSTTAPADSSTAGLGHVPSPYGELHLDPAAADSWNAMRQESIDTYGVDIYPAGPLSAYRSYEQQAELYQDYLNGTGPLAAPPGTSAHETGTAVDLQDESMRAVIDEIGPAYGWGKTEAPDEWWHVNYGW
jgi:LysM repeat protein